MKTTFWSLLLALSFLAGPTLTQADEAPGETTLHGYFLKQPDNTYVQVELVGIRMIFKLLDENYQEIDNTFTRGVMNVNPKGKKPVRMVIQPTGDGKSLQSSKNIKKPHLLTAIGRLFKGDDDQEGVPFNILYNQYTVEEVKVKPVPKK